METSIFASVIEYLHPTNNTFVKNLLMTMHPKAGHHEIYEALFYSNLILVPTIVVILIFVMCICDALRD